MVISNRRDFLRRAATAGCAVSLPGLAAAANVAGVSATNVPVLSVGAGQLTADKMNSSLIVVSQPVSAESDPRARTWSYVEEILKRAGLFFASVSAAQLEQIVAAPQTVIILAGQLTLTAAQRDALATWVRNGGALLGLGGTSGLDEIFGVTSQTPVGEGWMKIGVKDHPVLADMRSSLHVFGGHALRKSSATSLADIVLASGAAKGSALLENQFGKGQALLFGPDLIFSVVHIQQGLRVLQDGKPSPDDSAPVNDGVLKAEDGLVLDWQRDRTPATPEGRPIFLEPITDELRELIVRGVFHLARRRGMTLPVLWYWPRLLPAVAHMSHDTDGNDPQKAVALLEVMNRCRLKSTWCILYPGGYPREFYRTLASQEFELALHYDAMTGGAHTTWSHGDFLFQHRWLLREAGLDRISSNKNHYTRWEGRLDFFRWCEATGFESDETRGPSKKGTIGFPLGGSQPYFPLDDEVDRPRLLDVLEINLLTQDLVVTCPPEYGKALTDSVLRHHGVAHFLFHPAHILQPGVANALGSTVDYARSLGMEWWANRQICQWERLRRGVTMAMETPHAFALRTAKPLSQATLLFLRPDPASRSITVNGKPLASHPWSFHGFEFDAVTLDLAGETRVRVDLVS